MNTSKVVSIISWYMVGFAILFAAMLQITEYFEEPKVKFSERPGYVSVYQQEQFNKAITQQVVLDIELEFNPVITAETYFAYKPTADELAAQNLELVHQILDQIYENEQSN